jgi:penicillin-binding protein 2
VRAVRDATNGELRELPIRALKPLTVKDPSFWTVVSEGMYDVAHGSHGSARASAATAQYKFAGKTGTAQVVNVSSRDNIKAVTKAFTERQRDHGWFIAYAPADKPRIALAIIVENGGFGAQAAAPVARRMLDTYLLSPEALKEQDSKGKSPGITLGQAESGGD